MSIAHFYRSIIESLPEIIIVATPVTVPETGQTDFLIEYVSSAWEHISGSSRESILGKLVSQTIYTNSSIPWVEIAKKALSEGGSINQDHFSELVEKWLDITIIKLEGEHICINIANITEFKQSEIRLKQQNIHLSTLTDELATSKNNLNLKLEKISTLNQKLEKLAYYDKLTSLPNRTKFNVILGDILIEAKRKGSKFALAIFDIDNLKTINDTKGYDVGDDLIRQIAMRICSFRKDGVIPCRFGGDEFLLIIKNYDHDAELLYSLNLIQDSLRKPFQLLDDEINSSVSMGVATYPEDAENVHNLLKYADIALSDAKRRGKNTISLFHSMMQEKLISRINLEHKLLRTMEAEEFQIYYQPQFDVLSHQLRGFEALARWHDEELGYISPDDFIPVAEETRLIIPLGKWILRKAVSRLQEWQQALGFSGIMSVNVSPIQLRHSDFLDNLRCILAETGIPPRTLELEITEGILIDNFKESIRILEEIKKLGVGISLDDFGTGYASLSYLQHLPLTTLKIDKSFIANITQNKSIEYEITDAIVNLVNKMGIDSIAEGVETDEQLQVIKRIKCKTIQGYLTGRPLPQIECRSLIELGVYTIIE
ncbi:MAG TPA: EAL domain-containing protein [Treponema sp.]|nr:EAL domain-containing protein [Treponema sp.]